MSSEVNWLEGFSINAMGVTGFWEQIEQVKEVRRRRREKMANLEEWGAHDPALYFGHFVNLDLYLEAFALWDFIGWPRVCSHLLTNLKGYYYELKPLRLEAT